jgi:hypothetical protein
MGTAAGKTTVVSVDRGKPEEENPPVENLKPLEEESSEKQGYSAGEESPAIYPGVPPELAKLSVEELSQKEQVLRAEIQRGTAEKEDIEREKDDPASKAEAVQVEEDERKLDFELERKKKELRKVALAKIMKTQSELLATVTEGLVESLQAPVSMIKIAYGAEGDFAGQALDLFA